ncbi:MAG: FHA domain-containing protein, partial [Polyangiaceae bacterium]|nr:FHA domain-containing protein [Polyangiaceae bacterium]
MDSQGKAKVALTFALYQGDQLVRRDTIAQDIVKVGKDPRSHLRVDDELASRMHAVIEVATPADITLIDLGNEPGTLVNGQRVNKCKVRPGDQIQIGSTLILLESAEPVAAGAPQAGPMTTPAPFAQPAAASANPFAGANPFATAAAAPAAAVNPFAGANPFVGAPAAPVAAAAAFAASPSSAFVAAPPSVPTPG